MLDLIILVIVGVLCYNGGKKAHIKDLERKEFEEFRKERNQMSRVNKNK